MAAESSALYDRAMEHWGRGEREIAVRLLRDVVAADPSHPEAHDQLGLAALDADELPAAEAHFRDALDASLGAIEAEDGFISWTNALNRPWLRAHAHLALVFRRTARWAAAAAVHEQLLRWSPNDDLGVRFLLGEEHHRTGDVERAVSAHRASGRHPTASFGLAVALLELGLDADARVAVLHGVAQNRYVVPMLLDEAWTELAARPGRTGDPRFAADLVAQTRDQWTPAFLDELRRVWDDPRVRSWRGDLDDLGVAMEHAGEARRRALVEKYRSLVADARVEVLAEDLDRPLADDDETVSVAPSAWVTDMRHLLAATDPTSAIPEEARQLAMHRGRIVEAITSWGRATTIDTAIGCRRAPCPGHLRAVLDGDVIDWACTACGDSGRIGGWHGTPWDLGARPTDEHLRGVPVPTEWYDVLRNLPLGDARRPVARAVHASEGAELHGTPREYAELVDAAERAGALALVEYLRARLTGPGGSSG